MIHVQEVVTRDGFQMEPSFIPTEEKIRLINELSVAGFSKIEVTSFVSPRHVPQLKDAKAVLNGIEKNPNVTYVVLVPNEKGAELALQSPVDELNLVMSASATHNRANVNRSHSESLDSFSRIISMARSANVLVNGTVATAFGCPFEGEISSDGILRIVDSYLSMGMNSFTLADTTGMAYPTQVEAMVREVKRRFPEIPLTLHFHNTRGLGLSNILYAIEAGADRFDAALGGIGGCPFAPGASGNVCTEDVVHMLSNMGFTTSVDLDHILSLARELPKIIGHATPGQVAKAGKRLELHPSPF